MLGPLKSPTQKKQTLELVKRVSGMSSGQLINTLLT